VHLIYIFFTCLTFMLAICYQDSISINHSLQFTS
jgi:nucleoside recognition membrane protein YjiH